MADAGCSTTPAPVRDYLVYALSLDGIHHRYVGATTQGIHIRLSKHRTDARTRCAGHPFYDWVRSVGPDNIQATILGHTATIDDLGPAETWFITVLRALGYDLFNRGENGSVPVFRPEVQAKISATTRGRPMPEVVKYTQRLAHLGIRHREDVKARISATQIRRAANRPA